MSELETNTKNPSSRIVTFDLLRGYFLIVILCSYLALFPNIFTPLTGDGILYASAAEGFFLVSGIVLGIVRGQRFIHRPLKEAAGKLLKRSLQLYLASIILTLFFTLVAWTFSGHAGIKNGSYTPRGDLLGLIWNTIAYHYSYGWTDFLRQYAIFIFVSPLALWLLRKGQWLAVLVASAAVWACFPVSTTSGYMSQPISWQFIFFSGFVIGFHWEHITSWWQRRFSPRARAAIGASVCTTFVLTAMTSFALVFGHYLGNTLGDSLNTIHHQIQWMFDEDRLPIPRLLLGTIWFWGLFWLVRLCEPWIVKRLGWLLKPFGENWLYAYIAQAFVIFFTHTILAQLGIGGGLWINSIVTTLAISILYVAVRIISWLKMNPTGHLR